MPKPPKFTRFTYRSRDTRPKGIVVAVPTFPPAWPEDRAAQQQVYVKMARAIEAQAKLLKEFADLSGRLSQNVEQQFSQTIRSLQDTQQTLNALIDYVP